MSNSKLVTYTNLSPNNYGARTHKISIITPHCVVGQLNAKATVDMFADSKRGASSNYVIGTDGKIGMSVPENKASWCSSNQQNDERAVTIECASDTVEPYAMNNKVYNSLIKLCVDICKRNKITKLLWLESKEKTLAYTPKAGEAVLTAHRWFANKACPGDWLYSRYGKLAKEVTSELSGASRNTVASNSKEYKVKVTDNSLNIRSGAGVKHSVVGCIKDKGTYTIVQTKGDWGKLKSGAGWINLKYTKRV